MIKIGYIEGVGIYYRGTLPKINKNEGKLQPIYEALINSLEAIKTQSNNSENDEITKSLIYSKNLFSNESNAFNFQKITVEDSGIGFNDEEFNRFVALNDDSKPYSNMGTGRVQFIHYFDKTEITSIYKDENSSTGYNQLVFTLSKLKPFLDNNAIIRVDDIKEIDADSSFTSLSFSSLISKKDLSYYNTLTAEELKENIISHFLVYFCENREDLPKISIKYYADGELIEDLNIVKNNIQAPDKKRDIDIYYSKINGSQIEKSKKKETLNLKTFVISKSELKKNKLHLTSKGQIANAISLDSLTDDDHINNNRYLFLLSGEYIDSRDSDTRGKINIPKIDDFKKNELSLYEEEEILLEDIEEKSNRVIIELYEEIKNKKDEKMKNIEDLRQMFLLNPVTLQNLRSKININDSDDTILRKFYQLDAKSIATRDAKIKQQIKQLDELNKLDTINEDYQEKLKEHVDEFVKGVSFQNRTALTHYVARRKLVLDLFGIILNRQLKIQKTSAINIDEKLLHNLIFQQSSDNPEESDLWLINEDFIYFKGISESQLGGILINGNKIIKEELSKDEEEYRLKQKGDANQKRPDILLFPKEGKCIIIELKAPDVNVSNHLNQISRYASLINNLTKEEYNFNTYYGYLIGEEIDIDDIQDNDSDFLSAYHLNYIYRPYKRIVGKFGNENGSLYTEVIKYTTLLERAIHRNNIFIDKLK